MATTPGILECFALVTKGASSSKGANSTPPKNTQQKKSNHFCTCCKMTNHFVDSFFKLHDKPLNKQAYYFEASFAYVVAPIFSVNDTISVSHQEYESLLHLKSQLSLYNSQVFITQIGNLPYACRASSSSSWIINSCATNHMTGCLNCLPLLVLFLFLNKKVSIIQRQKKGKHPKHLQVS